MVIFHCYVSSPEGIQAIKKRCKIRAWPCGRDAEQVIKTGPDGGLDRAFGLLFWIGHVLDAMAMQQEQIY